MSHSLIAAYYAAFNAEDPAGMLACVSDDIEHRVNEGAVRHGRAAFAEFCAHMGVSYRERLEDIEIFKDFLVISERENGLNQIKISRWDGTDSYYLPFESETYTAYTLSNIDFDLNNEASFTIGQATLKGVDIGSRSIIQSGSVVHCDVPAGEIWGGNPAKFIRKLI